MIIKFTDVPTFVNVMKAVYGPKEIRPLPKELEGLAPRQKVRALHELGWDTVDIAGTLDMHYQKVKIITNR